jgi:hypothetical protein
VGTFPGGPDCDMQSRLNLVYTAVCTSAVSGLPCWIDSLADTTTRAVAKIARRAGGAVIPGDTVLQGARGHLVIDPSDQALNLSQVVE